MDGMLDKAARMLDPVSGDSKSVSTILKDQRIPSRFIKTAEGLAFLTVVKAGFAWFGAEVGAGIVVARRPDGGWSPPAAFQTGGVCGGWMLGASVIDVVLVINSAEQMKALQSKAMVKLGGDMQATLGPLGRDLQASVAGGTKGVAGCYAYSYSKGLFAGITVDAGSLWANGAENRKFYGPEVTTEAIFSGVARPIVDSPGLTRFYTAIDKVTGFASLTEEREAVDSIVNDRPLKTID